jgi:hypothetical protein
MSKDAAAIKAEIARIKKGLSKLGRFHPGSLSMQKRARGKDYYQLSYTHAGKGHTRYVRPGELAEVGRELENYQKFRQLTAGWVAQEIELAKLRRERGSKKG